MVYPCIIPGVQFCSNILIVSLKIVDITVSNGEDYIRAITALRGLI